MTSELVERAQRGDHEAFDALATAAYHRLYAIARRILRDGYAARIPCRMPSSRPGGRFRVFVIPQPSMPGSTDCSSTPATIRSGVRAGGPSSCPVLPIERPEPRDDFAQLADRDELERAFLELSVEHRAVLVLAHYVGLPAPEIGRILGIPPGTVASRLHYGARAMRAALGRGDVTPATIAEPGR